MKTHTLNIEILMPLGSLANFTTQAAALNSDDVTHIVADVATTTADYDITTFTDCYFAFDYHNDDNISNAMNDQHAEASTGLEIVAHTPCSGTLSSFAVASDTNTINTPRTSLTCEFTPC